MTQIYIDEDREMPNRTNQSRSIREIRG